MRTDQEYVYYKRCLIKYAPYCVTGKGVQYNTHHDTIAKKVNMLQRDK